MRDPLLDGRIRHIREMCSNFIRFDSSKAPVGSSALTDRAWLAQGILNILDGAIDAQIDRELGPRWTFMDNLNWDAIIAHEVKFADMPRIGNPPGFGIAAPTFGPAGTPRQEPADG